MRETSYGRIFGEAKGLPRGPHQLTREQVSESQHTRLLIATTESVAQRGYAAVTVAQIARHAGVSPRTFYDHFSDKQDCFLAAYDRFAAVLLERVKAALNSDGDLNVLIIATLTAYLGSLEADPLAARAFLIEGNSAGAAARKRRRDTSERFAAELRERHHQLQARDPRLRALPEMAYPAIVHAVRELTCDAIDTSEQPQPLALISQLTACLTETFTDTPR